MNAAQLQVLRKRELAQALATLTGNQPFTAEQLADHLTKPMLITWYLHVQQQAGAKERGGTLTPEQA